MDYRLVVMMNGRIVKEWDNISLQNQQEYTVQFTPPGAARQQGQVLLYQSGDTGQVYRQVSFSYNAGFPQAYVK